MTDALHEDLRTCRYIISRHDWSYDKFVASVQAEDEEISEHTGRKIVNVEYRGLKCSRSFLV